LYYFVLNKYNLNLNLFYTNILYLKKNSSNALLSSMAASVGVKEIYTVASKDHHSEYGADKKEGQSNLA
jgi:hypothetical protein